MHLYIGYKRYSSWSLRAWLVMQATGIPFTETVLPFAHDDSLKELSEKYATPASVPLLEHNGQFIWDSLAIMEFLAEHYPDKVLWPDDAELRALARSVSAEMHSGFSALRSEHPMNCHRVFTMTPSSAVQADLRRLETIWQHFGTIEKPAGNFLCGEFGIVDAMFAPVAWRALGYGLKLSAAFTHWSNAMMELPAMHRWVEEGARESWRVDETENIGV